MIQRRTLPKSMILGLILFGLIAFPLRPLIETHDLNRVLTPGYDAFGRNCFGLTLCAMTQTLISLLPVAAFCLSLSLGIALLTTLDSERFKFTLRSSLDLISALPGFLLALALGVLFPGAIFTYYLGALLMVSPQLIRYFESQLMKLSKEEFVVAAEAMGARRVHIWNQHFIPALKDSILSILPFTVLRLILIDTSLSFLGLSVAPEHETWGRLLAQGKDYLLEAPWVLFVAGTPLCVLVASFHLLSTEERL